MRKSISILVAAAALSTIALANGAQATEGQAPATTVATIDFDHAFTSVTTPRRENTPPNRERLRNAGWRRILAATS